MLLRADSDAKQRAPDAPVGNKCPQSTEMNTQKALIQIMGQRGAKYMVTVKQYI